MNINELQVLLDISEERRDALKQALGKDREGQKAIRVAEELYECEHNLLIAFMDKSTEVLSRVSRRNDLSGKTAEMPEDMKEEVK